MSSVQMLYELQAVDRELDLRHERLSEISALLGDDTALVSLRERAAELQSRLDEVIARQQEIDAAVTSFTEKIDQAEAKLYGGTVKSPRELSDLQADVDYLKRRRSEQEEILLTVLDDVESLQSGLQTLNAELEELQRAWEADQSAMAQEQEKLNSEVEQFTATRSGMTPKVPPADLSLYEQVRRIHGGRTVALVHQGRCEACHVTLATRQFQQVHTSGSPVRCSSCGLILLAV